MEVIEFINVTQILIGIATVDYKILFKSEASWCIVGITHWS